MIADTEHVLIGSIGGDESTCLYSRNAALVALIKDIAYDGNGFDSIGGRGGLSPRIRTLNGGEGERHDRFRAQRLHRPRQEGHLRFGPRPGGGGAVALRAISPIPRGMSATWIPIMVDSSSSARKVVWDGGEPVVGHELLGRSLDHRRGEDPGAFATLPTSRPETVASRRSLRPDGLPSRRALPWSPRFRPIAGLPSTGALTERSRRSIGATSRATSRASRATRPSSWRGEPCTTSFPRWANSGLNRAFLCLNQDRKGLYVRHKS
jgi:hypothetical protein